MYIPFLSILSVLNISVLCVLHEDHSSRRSPSLSLSLSPHPSGFNVFWYTSSPYTMLLCSRFVLKLPQLNVHDGTALVSSTMRSRLVCSQIFFVFSVFFRRSPRRWASHCSCSIALLWPWKDYQTGQWTRRFLVATSDVKVNRKPANIRSKWNWDWCAARVLSLPTIAACSNRC